MEIFPINTTLTHFKLPIENIKSDTLYRLHFYYNSDYTLLDSINITSEQKIFEGKF